MVASTATSDGFPTTIGAVSVTLAIAAAVIAPRLKIRPFAPQ